MKKIPINPLHTLQGNSTAVENQAAIQDFRQKFELCEKLLAQGEIGQAAFNTQRILLLICIDGINPPTQRAILDQLPKGPFTNQGMQNFIDLLKEKLSNTPSVQRSWF